MKDFTSLCILAAISITLNGCFLAAVGGAGAEAGYVSGQNDRTTGEVVNDQVLYTKVKAALGTTPNIGNVDVTVRKGVVTLRGTLASEDAKSKAISTTRNVTGVKGVIDKLAVNP